MPSIITPVHIQGNNNNHRKEAEAVKTLLEFEIGIAE